MSIKKKIAVLGAAGALALTGGVAADIATSHNTSTAEAVTYGSPWKQYVGFGRCAVFMHADYNWWEETFQGKRDGAEFQYYAAC